MTKYAAARLITRDGRHVHSTGVLEVKRGLIWDRYPKVLTFYVYARGEVLFFDTGERDSIFRIYREAPLVTAQGE